MRAFYSSRSDDNRRAAGAGCVIHDQRLDFIIESFRHCRPGGEAISCLFVNFVVQKSKNSCAFVCIRGSHQSLEGVNVNLPDVGSISDFVMQSRIWAAADVIWPAVKPVSASCM